jgi:hypothetical protein
MGPVDAVDPVQEARTSLVKVVFNNFHMLLDTPCGLVVRNCFTCSSPSLYIGGFPQQRKRAGVHYVIN